MLAVERKIHCVGSNHDDDAIVIKKIVQHEHLYLYASRLKQITVSSLIDFVRYQRFFMLI